tara:strand:+ start:236 stop:457 length:222 start_codon:yes stop_codon:yes gene_type:complete
MAAKETGDETEESESEIENDIIDAESIALSYDKGGSVFINDEDFHNLKVKLSREGRIGAWMNLGRITVPNCRV